MHYCTLANSDKFQHKSTSLQTIDRITRVKSYINHTMVYMYMYHADRRKRCEANFRGNRDFTRVIRSIVCREVVCTKISWFNSIESMDQNMGKKKRILIQLTYYGCTVLYMLLVVCTKNCTGHLLEKTTLHICWYGSVNFPRVWQV